MIAFLLEVMGSFSAMKSGSGCEEDKREREPCTEARRACLIKFLTIVIHLHLYSVMIMKMQVEK